MVYGLERGHCHGGDLSDGRELLVVMLLQRENFDGARGSLLTFTLLYLGYVLQLELNSGC